MNSISAVTVNCGTIGEATRLGEACLKQRLIACYDVLPRLATGYYWPPQTGRIERGRGTTLVLIALPRTVRKVRTYVRQLHPDTLPYIGWQTIQVAPDYYAWVSRELAAK